MPAIISRIWKSTPKGDSTAVNGNWVIWDRGDELWELKGDVLRHFGVIERTTMNNIITERLKLLRESAIPLEAIRHTIRDWDVSESLEQVTSVAAAAQTLSPLAMPAPPSTSSPLSTPSLSPRSKGPYSEEKLPRSKLPPASSGKKTIAQAMPATEEASTTRVNSVPLPCQQEGKEQSSQMKTPPEKLLQQAQGLEGEESSQYSYIPPMEFWSSLSQWIPQHALFQPSLHHQASLELSDTPAQTYPYQINSSKNSQTAQGQHQHVRQDRQTKPYHPKTFSQDLEIPKRPLFI